MSNSFGENIRISIFGESHSEEIGVVIEGFPKNFRIDTGKLMTFLSRRAPGKGPHTTSRREADIPHFLSGVEDSVTTGGTIRAIIKNTNVRSGDYENLRAIPRPGHADFAAYMKYGKDFDMRGGGKFSGRLTAPLCIAGGLALQYLEEKGIKIGAHVLKIGSVCDKAFDMVSPELSEVTGENISVLDKDAGERMMAEILSAKEDLDSVGGVIECAAVGVPAALGEPMFGGVENKISGVVFGIPAVKGIEFGAGFGVADLRGSENNDAFAVEKGSVRTKTNNHGGALGGITTGMPIIFRAAIKPTPSIAKVQKSVDLLACKEVEMTVQGRHDPCIVPRAVPVMEAAAALAIIDMMK